MKKHLIFAAALVALVACNNEDYTPMDDPNAPMEIRLSSGIDVQTRANSAEVPDKQIAEGQQVGVFINDAVTGDVVSANLKYNADGSGGLTLATTSPAQEIPYYPANGNAVRMTAYHPYKDGATITDNGYEFAVSTDQSSDASYYASDLLYSENKEYARQKTAHNIAFEHKLSKVECTLTSGNGTPDLTGATVSIVGAQTNIFFSPADGTLSSPTNATTADIKLSSATATGPYIGIIPPQTYSKGSQFLKITLASGGTFYYTIPNGGADNDLALAGGNVYKYTITVNRTGLSVTSTIEPWGNGGTHSGDAEMP